MYVFTDIPRTSSNVSVHNKRIPTMSYGGSAISEGCPDRILEESRDESGIASYI